MKKRITLILSVLCLFAMVLALASCGHEHSYGSEWKSDKNNHWHACDVEGEDCEEVSGKAAHSYVDVSVTKAPNCTEKGEKIEKCSVCGYERNAEIAALGHDYNETVVPPTCTVGGVTNVTCNREGCDYTGTKDETGLGDHAWKDATCDAPKTCTECGATDGEALGHELTETVVDPTCAREGKTKVTCTRCDYYEEKDVVPALGHTYNIVDNPAEGTYTDKILPTCTTAGQRYFRCTVCRLIPLNDGDNNIVELPALGHDLVETVVPPTCVLAGMTEVTCSRCEEYYETKDETDPTGHKTYKEADAVLGEHYVISTEPTCTEDGLHTFVCVVCKEQTDETVVVPALDHNMVVVVEAWCGNGGQIEYECDRVCRGVECNETKVEAGEGEYRHVYNEGSVVIPATCVDYGVYTCVTCLATVDAYADGEIGLPTGVHVYDVYNSTVNPTCAAEGYDIFGCSAGECGTTEFREYTQRVAHTLGEVSQFGTVTCQICNKSYVDVTAEKAEGADKMCFGCGNDPCTCETSADWEGYIEPKEPFAIAANSEFVVTEIEWTSGKQPLAIGNGILIFKSQANATYTVSVYEQDGGEVLYTFTVTGTYAIVDLYQYPTVGKVVITATEDATVSIYSVVE